MEVPDVVDLCYSSGWRDKNLITMVSIVGAESNFNENYQSKLLGRFGLFALPSNDPETFDPTHAVKIARELYEEDYFYPWTSFVTGNHMVWVKRAVEGAGDFYFALLKKELLAS